MIRRIIKVFRSRPTLEGAGVHLKRAFGYGCQKTSFSLYHIPLFDPFLMLDDFRIDEKEKFIKGFPWHPHRGIETITYILNGSVEHGDSMGNKGVISSGDVQWMTAGSGIIHQEMPFGDDEGKMYGFQLWANLPSSNKMMPPRYRDIKSNTIPTVETENGVKIKVIAGSYSNVIGPTSDIVIDPSYFDVFVPPKTTLDIPTNSNHNTIVYVIGGKAHFSEGDSEPFYSNESTLLFDKGEAIRIRCENDHVRFIFLCGKPIHEPVAWGGPIVMNTQEELKLAFLELDNNTFIK